jgi:hypothetical protein
MAAGLIEVRQASAVKRYTLWASRAWMGLDAF